MITWYGEAPPAPARIGCAGRVRMVLRGAAVLAVLYGGIGVFLALRGIEHLVAGGHRRWSPGVVTRASRIAIAIMGIGYRVIGRPMDRAGAVVSNHASWLDIFTLNACQRVNFVSKAEVAGWTGIGWLARQVGTLFIRRDAREAKDQQAAMEDRFRRGDRLVFFPEGTSSDGLRVLPFKSTLFQAFQADGLRDSLWIQPVTVIYAAPPGADPRFYGWWGDMGFGPHLGQVLAQGKQGSVTVVFHDPVRAGDYPDRKALARVCETAVRAAMPDHALLR